MHRSARHVSLHSPQVHSALRAAQAFENILAFAVRRVCPKKPLWIEHEGRHVGKVGCTNLNLCLLRLSKLKFPTFCALQASVPFGVLSWVTDAPQGLAWEQIETTGVNVFHLLSGALVMLSMGKDLRVRRLVDDYCSADGNVEESREKLKICTWSSRYFDIFDIISIISIISTFHEFADFVRHRGFGSWGITGLSKRLGGQRVKDAHRLLDEDQWHEAGFFLLSNIGDCIGFGISDDTGCSNDVGLLWQAVWEVGSRELLFETDWCGMWLDRSHLFRDLDKVLHDFQMS